MTAKQNKEKVGAEAAEELTSVDFETVGATEYDAYAAMCQLANAELERIHKKVDDYDADSPTFRTQSEMLKVWQDRALELTTVK